jgi:hypothetical protein
VIPTIGEALEYLGLKLEDVHHYHGRDNMLVVVTNDARKFTVTWDQVQSMPTPVTPVGATAPVGAIRESPSIRESPAPAPAPVRAIRESPMTTVAATTRRIRRPAKPKG